MKTKIKTHLIFPLYFLLVIIIIFITIPQINKANDDPFIIGAMDNGWDVNSDLDSSKELSLNVWSKYTHPDKGWLHFNGTNWIHHPADRFDSSISAYKDFINGKILSNDSNGLKTIMDRPKVQYLAFGQSSEYQMEYISTRSEFWFYGYKEHSSNPNIIDFNDNGTMVKKCTRNPNVPDNSNADTLTKKLEGNREQANTSWPVGYIGDTEYDWYIMPKIRIDTSYANNPANFEKKVCDVIVSNWNGDEVIQTLKVKHFKSEISSIYNGEYLEIYYDYVSDPINNLKIDAGTWFNPDTLDPYGGTYDSCKIDFRIFWYDNCDMWVDYIKVQNEPAYQLLTVQRPLELNMIKDEVEQIANLHPDKIFDFYIEEFEFNHTPSIAKVNDLIQTHSGNQFSLMVNYNPSLFKAFIPESWKYWFTAQDVKKYLIERANLKKVLTMSYDLTGWDGSEWDGVPLCYYPNTLPNIDPSQSGYNVNTGFLGFKTSPESYDVWLQNHIDNNILDFQLMKNLKLSNELSRISNIPFYFLHQSHLIFQPSVNNQGHKLKEPTNEEVELMANMAIGFGAKGIFYFAYMGYGDISDSTHYTRGLLDPGLNVKRKTNVYGQPKWDKYVEINAKYKKWGSHLVSFTDYNKINSYNFRLYSEKTQLLNNTFLNDLISYNPLPSDFNTPDINTPENPENSYFQVSLFNNDNPFDNYLMIQNRRCSPYYPHNSENGGRRSVRIKIDQNSNEFSGFNNWKIIDLETENTVATFDKNIVNSIDFGWYLPGEGKLYKIAPVMQEGGTLVTNEVVDGLSIVCKGEVLNGGYDITLNPGTNIIFNNNAGFTINGGSFISGAFPEDHNAAPVNINGADNNENQWGGFDFENCELVHITKTNMSKVKQENTYATYMVSAVDCPNVIIKNCNFTIEDQRESCGAIQIHFLDSPQEMPYPSILIHSNYFNLSSAENVISVPAVSIMNYGYSQTPAYISWNRFEGNNSTIAISLSNVTGGVINKNTINGFPNAINLLATHIDLFKNNLSFNTETSNSNLSLSSGSLVNLSTINQSLLGGFNLFNNNGDNISTDNSYTALDEGYNYFYTHNSSVFHITGSFNDDYNVSRDVQASKNCFYVDNSSGSANHDVKWHTASTNVSFNFLPLQCTQPEIISGELIEYSEYITDTLWNISGGFGGGLSSKNSVGEINIYKAKTDSLKIKLRKQKLSDVKRIGNELLNSFIDSAGIINVIQPLYYSSLMTDDSVNTNITALKSKLEQIISSNGYNSALVLRCNYFIQKCKVKLGDYQSALTGFQQFMNSYPYSWEGIVSSWDYSATQLLAGGGSGGGLSDDKSKNLDHELHQLNEFSLSEAKKAIIENDSETFDDKIKKSVTQTLNDTKESSINELKKYEEKVVEIKKSKSDEPSLTKTKSKDEMIKEKRLEKTIEKKIEQKRVINESIKPRKPESISEQINFVNNDIKKIISVTGSTESDNSKGTETPHEYSLSQNYPNPFNPNTKISFTIPKDIKVTLVIYDILGREITKLVNNELKQTGIHTYDFNASKLASGIYFYSIITNEFKQTKRMVLIK
ncbi:MAG TPA: T9SS type A sorting domain-containing protein [Ignavibacteria bacterium]|nr:T9SS type A sorting domain-containing protein [Ignavibacteria bacterium]